MSPLCFLERQHEMSITGAFPGVLLDSSACLAYSIGLGPRSYSACALWCCERAMSQGHDPVAVLRSVHRRAENALLGDWYECVSLTLTPRLRTYRQRQVSV